MSSNPDQPIGWRFLWTPRWAGYAAMLLIFSIACVLLGNWQFERRAEARAEIDRIDANYDAASVPLAQELPDPAQFDEDTQKWQTAWVEGRYIGEPYLARNRPGSASAGAGSDLIQTLLTDDGRIFFVDRGWVPIDASGSGEGVKDLAALPIPPQGNVRVEVRLRASEPAIPGRSSSGRTVASIELPELARLVDAEDWSDAGVIGEVYTGAYGMLVAESADGERGILPPKPERDEGPHLSYALQWYVFILIALIGVAYAAHREHRTLNAEDEAVQAQEERSVERKRRRGPSDAEEEDALLDA